MKKILIVEDEKGIANMEKNYLEKNGFYIDIAYDGQDALNMFYKNSYDLIILDLMIPLVSGEEVLKEIRKTSHIPVILVTAKVKEKDILTGFRIGADDYMKKPFSGLEMVERVKAVLRRRNWEKTSSNLLISQDKRLLLDFENNLVTKDGVEVALTKNELLILETLASSPSKTFTREEIIDLSFGIDYDAYDRAIDTHIKNIRQKLDDDPKKSNYIKTVYGIGYKLGGFIET